MPSTSYYDMVGDLRQLANELYERAGYLRDAAEGKEKDLFNHIREVTGPLWSEVSQFQDALPEKRASMELGGWKKPTINLGGR